MSAITLCGRRAELDDDVDVEVEIGFALGRAQERERITAILTSPASEGRAGPALQLALGSDLDAQEVVELLQKIPAALPERSHRRWWPFGGRR